MELLRPEELAYLDILYAESAKVIPPMTLNATGNSTKCSFWGVSEDQYRQLNEALQVRGVSFQSGGMRYTAADYGWLQLDLRKIERPKDANAPHADWVKRATARLRNMDITR